MSLQEKGEGTNEMGLVKDPEEDNVLQVMAALRVPREEAEHLLRCQREFQKDKPDNSKMSIDQESTTKSEEMERIDKQMAEYQEKLRICKEKKVELHEKRKDLLSKSSAHSTVSKTQPKETSERSDLSNLFFKQMHAVNLC